jgi:hypothetical protein
MSQVTPFHDRNAPGSSSPRYDTNDECPVARYIPAANVRLGSGGFYLCEHCRALAAQGPRRETRRPSAPN